MAIDHRMSLQKLEVFCAVVELGGVHRAADHLFVSQPVVSAHLKSLQQRLDTKLFAREGRRMVLTESGQAVYVWAQEVLSRRTSLARELEDIAAGTSGRAVVAASMSLGNYYLPPVLVDFQREHPDAHLTLLVSDPETALRRTEAGEADFCVVMTDVAIDPELFELTSTGEDDLVLIVRARDALPDEIEAETVSTLPCIVPPSSLAVRRLQDAALSSIGVHSRPMVMELGSVDAIKQAVAAGIGCAFLSRRAVADELTRGVLREVHIRGVELTQPILLVRRRNRHLTRLQQRLMAAVGDRIPHARTGRS
ncbi:LysR substrate-binding domain-containing protein [Nocardioides humi]|uniref:Selenium metabolism-associated LysR family transcriptional regulator n=1 Tax=Nocardioides humi TaxID=449461 RepID=A0ABN2A7R8_9ACTN|nr:LysR substrate-binding domain-containing protein [Nocardioides humi]